VCWEPRKSDPDALPLSRVDQTEAVRIGRLGFNSNPIAANPVEGVENLARECAFRWLKRGHDIVLGGGSIREHNNGILGMRTPRNVFLIGSMLVQLAGIPAFPQQPPAAVEANPAGMYGNAATAYGETSEWRWGLSGSLEKLAWRWPIRRTISTTRRTGSAPRRTRSAITTSSRAHSSLKPDAGEPRARVVRRRARRPRLETHSRSSRRNATQ
jgi:hypothetical protein